MATPVTGFHRSIKLDNITMHSESGGHRFDKHGHVLTSPKGAMGEMQVTAETARNPGFGIRPWNGSLDDLTRVGREYRAALEHHYNGNLALMWAAYNWGHGHLDRAIHRFGENWFQHIPRETQSYVLRNLREYGYA